MSRILRAEVVSGLVVLALGLGLACDDVTNSNAPRGRPVTVDVFPKDGNDGVNWRVDVVGGDIDHRSDPNTLDYLIRIRDDQGRIVEERNMKWRDMTPPEASADAMFLMSDPTFPDRLHELHEDGASVVDIVSALAELLTERGDDSSGEILDALETRLSEGGR